MSPHLSDADLVLYRQGDAPNGEAVAAHLASCAACRRELETWSRVLALVEADSAPEQDAAYGVRVWNAIETRLDAPAPARRVAWPVSWRGWLRWCAPPAALAVAVAALVMVVVPRSSIAPVAPVAQAPAALADPAADTVLVAAVEDHLERTSLMLTELNNARDSEDVGDVHALAEDLASANRLYRQSAALSGDAQIGRILDDLERVLLEVAHAPDGATPGADAIESLRGRLDTRGVAFKVRLASAELRAREGGEQGL
jgi:hypothetical protein